MVGRTRAAGLSPLHSERSLRNWLWFVSRCAPRSKMRDLWMDQNIPPWVWGVVWGFFQLYLLIKHWACSLRDFVSLLCASGLWSSWPAVGCWRDRWNKSLRCELASARSPRCCSGLVQGRSWSSLHSLAPDQSSLRVPSTLRYVSFGKGPI